MSHDGESRLKKLKTAVWIHADQLAQAAAGGKFPVPLRRMAAEAKIKKIKFEPLLSSAGLQDKVSSFVIWVNTEARQVDQPAGKELDVENDDWSSMRPAVRFSIAHEIAHVLIINAARAGKLSLGGRVAFVERACNEIARVILLPRELYTNSFPSGMFDLNAVAHVVRTARVSPEVLIRRSWLDDLRRFREPHQGVLAFVRVKDDTLTVVEFQACGTQAIYRFGDPQDEKLDGARRAMLLKDWSIEETVGQGLWEGDGCTESKSIPDAVGAGLPCELSTLRIAESGGFLLSIRVTGKLISGRQRLFQ